jgi:hypothetical protein
MDGETWGEIVGYEGIYEVSDLGNVRSRRIPRSGRRFGPWRLLSPVVDRVGRGRVRLYLGGKAIMRLVSHLVADAFLPAKLPTDTVVRHLNDDPTDNRACNLAWGTYSDNMADAFRNGKRKSPSWSACLGAQLTGDIVGEIRRLYATGKFSQRELAAQFGVDHSTIGRIVRRQAWKHIL